MCLQGADWVALMVRNASLRRVSFTYSHLEDNTHCLQINSIAEKWVERVKTTKMWGKMFAELPMSFEVNKLNCSSSMKTYLGGIEQHTCISRNS